MAMPSKVPLPYQKILAHELTLKRPAHELRKLSQSLASSTVDLNPHQIEAALFAFNSPISRGAILCDEVGLGKTIEAGLIISQLWAEGKRKIIIVVPASLRKQWQNELLEKFDIPSAIIDGSEYKAAKKEGIFNPFVRENLIVITSLPFAFSKSADIKAVGKWHLVVIDEAHRLRNVYKKGNKTAQGLRELFKEQPKALLTATPLQNSLMELYGLTSFVDDKLLGTEYSFRSKFMSDRRGLEVDNLDELKTRLSSVYIRTLRKQVQEYIPYTNRISMVEDFTPSDDELRLYEIVSDYLQRAEVAAIKHSQRALMVLIYRKILASSSFAIAQTLESLIGNLDRQLKGLQAESLEDLINGIDGYEEEMEEIAKKENGETIERNGEVSEEVETNFTPEDIETEIKELIGFKKLAEGIDKNSKGDALVIALRKAFEHNREMGWPEKAVIFTESRRTQHYLYNMLSNAGYREKITTFSGTNEGPIGKRAYERWLQERVRHEKDGRLSKEASLREALIHEFRYHTSILIATEAGSEGINLQFCNVVVNYDLPWNPQRIEQRIGRCHRYGQKYDVVVLNFLNRKNAADHRVFELLDQKLRLFDGVFGASDEVLGAIGSGVDFEKRILDIYQSCRSEAEIHAAFDALQSELSQQIMETMLQARTKLIENFDDEVRVRLRTRDEEIKKELTAFDLVLLNFVVSSLNAIDYKYEDSTYYLNIPSFPTGIIMRLPGDVRPGQFFIGKGKGEHETAVRLHLGHPLVRAAISAAKEIPAEKVCSVRLEYAGHKITALEPMLGQTGYCASYKLLFKGLEEEEHLRHVFLVDTGAGWEPLSNDICEKMMTITSAECNDIVHKTPSPALVEGALIQAIDDLLKEIGMRNEDYYEREMDKLETYSEEAVLKMHDDLTKLEDTWKEAKKKRQKSLSFEDRMSARKEVQRLEQEYSKMVDKIGSEKKKLFEEKDHELKSLEKKLKIKVEKELIAQAMWRMA
jgi:adenine-specific DNA-methyltransferase